jgi:hypothetical protein
MILNNNISINFVGWIGYPSIGKMITDGLDGILSLMDGLDSLNEFQWIVNGLMDFFDPFISNPIQIHPF